MQVKSHAGLGNIKGCGAMLFVAANVSRNSKLHCSQAAHSGCQVLSHACLAGNFNIHEAKHSHNNAILP